MKLAEKCLSVWSLYAQHTTTRIDHTTRYVSYTDFSAFIPPFRPIQTNVAFSVLDCGSVVTRNCMIYVCVYVHESAFLFLGRTYVLARAASHHVK